MAGSGVRIVAGAVAALAVTISASGCGGSNPASSGATPNDSAGPAPAGTLQALAGPKPIAMVPGTSDFGPGNNRFSFLVITSQNKVIERPTARIWVSRGLRQKPFQQTTARLVTVAAPNDTQVTATKIYVTSIRIPSAGKYWLLAKPEGAAGIAALGNMVVGKHPAAPAIGDRAIPSRNPVLRPGVAPKTVTTADPPDRILLQTTIAKAMAARHPFVVTFATPLFCQSRTCGPVVQVVESLARRWQGKGVDFIHIEIYKDNDPAKGTNRWVQQWRLPTEPFTFVVDRRGIIRDRFEGAFSADELQAAVQKIAPA